MVVWWHLSFESDHRIVDRRHISLVDCCHLAVDCCHNSDVGRDRGSVEDILYWMMPVTGVLHMTTTLGSLASVETGGTLEEARNGRRA